MGKVLENIGESIMLTQDGEENLGDDDPVENCVNPNNRSSILNYQSYSNKPKQAYESYHSFNKLNDAINNNNNNNNYNNNNLSTAS